MAALKTSLLTLIVLSSCAIAQTPVEVDIKNAASGCFLMNVNKIDIADPVILNISVSPNDSGDCPCKSALLKYSVVQKLDGYENFLISGSFSPMDISELALPLSVQSRLIIQGKPVLINVSCGSI